MPVPWRRLLLADVLLKLAGRSSDANVVFGDPTESVSAEAPDSLSWDGRDVDQTDTAFEGPDRISPAYEAVATSANQTEQVQETSVRDGRLSGPHTLLSGSTSAAKQADPKQASDLQTTDHLPVRGQHRRTSSATSDISLASVVSTTGAYTGFTQSGQYDLYNDVILRGEFISEQQSKACTAADP